MNMNYKLLEIKSFQFALDNVTVSLRTHILMQLFVNNYILKLLHAAIAIMLRCPMLKFLTKLNALSMTKCPFK